MAKRKRHKRSKTLNQGSASAPRVENVPRTLLEGFNNDTDALDKAILALWPGQGLRVNRWGVVVPFKPHPRLWKISYSRRKE